MNTSLLKLKAKYVLSLKPQQLKREKVNYNNKTYSTTTSPAKKKTLFWGPLLISAGKKDIILGGFINHRSTLGAVAGFTVLSKSKPLAKPSYIQRRVFGVLFVSSLAGYFEG